MLSLPHFCLFYYFPLFLTLQRMGSYLLYALYWYIICSSDIIIIILIIITTKRIFNNEICRVSYVAYFFW